MVKWVKIFKSEKTIEIHLVRLTEVCGKVLIVKYAYKSVETALLLSNVIDADHQNSCLFTNKGHFLAPLCVLMVFWLNFMSKTLPIAITGLLEEISDINGF